MELPDRPVIVIPLLRSPAGVGDEPADLGLVEAIGRPGGADDVFLHHHAAHVVGSVEEGELPDLRPHRHPARLDIGNVVEIKPRQGEHRQILMRVGEK